MKADTSILNFLLIAIWFSHLIQVFVPETGFDALWYHLPVIEAVIKNRGLVYLPTLYQSLNPLFADLIFGLGYLVARDFGTKISAYLFGLALAFSSYKTARLFLSNNWSLLLTIIVSTFQVVAWQSASFYVDVAKAVFDLGAFYFLLKYQKSQRQRHLLISALIFSMSLGTKLFSLFLLPVYLLLTYLVSEKNRLRQTGNYLAISLLIPLPFYIFAFLHTGNPFYALAIHGEKLAEIGGFANRSDYLADRTRWLPISLFQLTLSKDYTSIIFLIFLPIIWQLRKLTTHPKLVPLLIFATTQYLLWWYLPPVSTRYALAGFISLALLYLILLSYKIRHNQQYLLPILISIILAIMINLAPRLLVNLRSLNYLAGRQTKQQYLEQFYDGSIDHHIKEWHFRATP